MRTWRVPVVSALTVGIFILSVLTPIPAVADDCVSYKHRYYLGAGTAITVRVAFVDAVLEVCRSASGEFTDAEASQAVGATTAGSVAGFSVEAGAAYVDVRNDQGVLARYRGRIRVCVATHTSICSPSNEYAFFGMVGNAIYTVQTCESRVDVKEPWWCPAPERTSGVHYYEDA